jgi:hypothetical protein
MEGRKVGHLMGPAIILVTLAVLILAIVGCGGGEDEAPAEEVPSRLTKAQLAEQMGDICQEHTDTQVVDIEGFEKRHGLPPSSQGAVPSAQMERELTVVMVPIVEDTIRDLEGKLRPSEQQVPTFEAFLRALEHGISYSRRDPSWIVTGKAEPFSQARVLAAKLGTAYCGQA